LLAAISAFAEHH